MTDEAEILPLVEAAHRGRKDEDRRALVAEHEKLHLAPELRAPPLPIIPLHRFALARPRASSINRHATSASCQSLTSEVLPSSSVYVRKNVSISRSRCGARSRRPRTSSKRGSPTGTARIF